jgi:hypothetical protein
VITSREFTLSTEADALAFFKTGGLIPGQDPSLVGVGLFDNFFNPIPVPGPGFFFGVNNLGWTYHIDAGPSSNVRDFNDVACVLINVAKLYRNLKKDPITKKKPATLTFRVKPPAKPATLPDHGGRLKWSLQAGIYKSKLTPPDKGGPKEDERRTFPVEDKTTPTPGIPGESTTQYHLPTWKPVLDSIELTDPASTDFLEVKITFGTSKVAPKVEITSGSGGGGGIG